MSKLEEAYSEEYEYIIDAEKAYELFWDGTITDKRAFQCTDSKCKAQITCVNIDKKRAEMKRTPHFKCYGQHSKECDAIKEYRESQVDKGEKGNGNPIKYLDDTVDIFSFNRPKRDGIIAKTKESIDTKDVHKEKKARIQSEYNINGRRSSTYYSVKPLISKFEKYSEENTLDKHFINIKGFNISYKRMFVNIRDTNIEDVEKYYRVYYGAGKIYKAKKNPNDFVVFFQGGFGSKGIKTGIYLSSTVIDAHYRKNKWREELESLVGVKDKEIIFFVNSKPEIKKEMIYLPISSMDFIDYRIIND